MLLLKRLQVPPNRNILVCVLHIKCTSVLKVLTETQIPFFSEDGVGVWSLWWGVGTHEWTEPSMHVLQNSVSLQISAAAPSIQTSTSHAELSRYPLRETSDPTQLSLLWYLSLSV